MQRLGVVVNLSSSRCHRERETKVAAEAASVGCKLGMSVNCRLQNNPKSMGVRVVAGSNPAVPTLPFHIAVRLPDPIAHDFTWAREKMVQEQLMARGIKHRRVLEAMRKMPRHFFVDPGLISRAYDDRALPIGDKQTLSQPYMAARMTEALDLRGEEKVLEVGTGSGYQTAVLAEICFNVFSVEKIRALARKAREVLDKLEYHNIAIHVGDGTIGWSEHAPYDAMIVTAGAPELPGPLLDQLSIGGRLVIPVGDEQMQVLTRVTRGTDGFSEEQLGDCKFVKLWGKYGWRE